MLSASDLIADLLPSFQLVGKDLAARGLVSSHGGNLSVRFGEQLVITRHGSMLGHLTAQDLVPANLNGLPGVDGQASFDLPIHRAIYRRTAAQAVVHAHPIYATALSLARNVIKPVDFEAARLLMDVPVVDVDDDNAVNGERIAPLLQLHRVAMMRGHGSVAVGEDLPEGLHWTTALEMACQILVLWEKATP